MTTTRKLTTTQIAQAALLAALTLVLSYIETLIPLPVTVPGIKLGLANITVLFALYLIDTKTAGLLMLIKIIVSSLLFGSPMMIIYSFCGSLLAFAGMYLLKKTDKVSIVVVSIVAAVLHNIGQLAAAAWLLATPLVFVNLPVLLVAACITGSITGAIAIAVIHALEPTLSKGRRGIVLEPEDETVTDTADVAANAADTAVAVSADDVAAKVADTAATAASAEPEHEASEK